MTLKLGGNKKQFNNEMDDLVSNNKMPLGKHRGKLISKLNLNYLGWIVHQDWLKDPLKSKLEKEFNKRKDNKECFGHLDVTLKRCKRCAFYDECSTRTEEKETTISYEDIDIEETFDEYMDKSTNELKSDVW